MPHMASLLFGSEEVFANSGLWIFLSVGAVALFVVFIPLVSWIESRRKEREAYYKAEMMRRIAESNTDGAKAALELLREDNRLAEMRRLEGMKIGGLITTGVGVALIAFFYAVAGSSDKSSWAIGLIPMMVGVAMLAYVFALARPVQ